MSLSMKSAMGGMRNGAGTSQLRGNGPCVVLVGTDEERLRVSVAPSGKYLIEIVDSEGKPSKHRFILHRRAGSRVVPIVRKRIRGYLA